MEALCDDEPHDVLLRNMHRCSARKNRNADNLHLRVLRDANVLRLSNWVTGICIGDFLRRIRTVIYPALPAQKRPDRTGAARACFLGEIFCRNLILRI